MAFRLSKSDPDKEPWWMPVCKGLFLLLLGAFLFWLVQSMVIHHFFNGGSLNYRGGH